MIDREQALANIETIRIIKAENIKLRQELMKQDEKDARSASRMEKAVVGAIILAAIFMIVVNLME